MSSISSSTCAWPRPGDPEPAAGVAAAGWHLATVPVFDVRALDVPVLHVPVPAARRRMTATALSTYGPALRRAEVRPNALKQAAGARFGRITQRARSSALERSP